jgi:nucleotide-binding universal stress UspA family protein
MVGTQENGPSVTSPDSVTTHPIVVGVDSTPSSLFAVEWAAAEAAARHEQLHIVHSWSWPHLAPWLTSADHLVREDLQRAGESLLRSYRIAARDAGATQITSAVREGPAHEVLDELSEDAAMVVVGSHHVGGLARTVLGSTSRAVAGAAVSPVIVVNTRAGAARRPSRLAVGIAALPSDEKVLRFAFGYAHQHHLPMDVLFCWDGGDPPLVHVPVPASARAWLAESVAGWRGEYPDVPMQVSVHAVHAVTGLLAAGGTDGLIVVGRRAHRPPVLGSHLGSVSLGVIHHAECAIAIVPT